MKKLKYAQDLIKTSSSHAECGFNTFISGGQEPKGHEYGDKGEWYARLQGYQFAEKMAKEDGIAFTKPFKCGKSDSCHPFEYGGFFVCNACGNAGVDKDWWKIKVEKDGNQYCCHGLGFENNHIGDANHNDYAFGDTFEGAIKNYGELFLKQS